MKGGLGDGDEVEELGAILEFANVHCLHCTHCHPVYTHTRERSRGTSYEIARSMLLGGRCKLLLHAVASCCCAVLCCC